ncbi:MAG: DUF4124 domain-containing protein [Pseudomonadota bacterium]
MFHLILLILFACLLYQVVDASEIYRWRDENGNVHFSDEPPPKTQAEVINVQPNVYKTPSVQVLKKSFKPTQKVIMYSTSWCGYCEKARQYFAAQKIPFKEYDIETTQKGKQDYERLEGKGVPIILVGQKRMNGFGIESFEEFYKPK